MSVSRIQTQLHNQTQADASSYRVNDSRYYYDLYFECEIGWDWVDTQVYKTSEKVSRDLEPYEIKPAENVQFRLVVREVDRRANIDENQHDLSNYESA